MTTLTTDDLWQQIRLQTQNQAVNEPVLASFLHASILNHDSLESALSFILAHKLGSPAAPALMLREIIQSAYKDSDELHEIIRKDILAVCKRDPACKCPATPVLYFKGFHALQCYRIAHYLWLHNRKNLALFFQNRISQQFGADIHPAAKLGKGIMLDHATGIVIGETATVGNNVAIMQSVTLGGTGKEHEDRHPKVGEGVLISAGAKILGNITIGDGAKIGAGSVVLHPVAPHTTVCGVPAKPIGKPAADRPSFEMNHNLDCDVS